MVLSLTLLVACWAVIGLVVAYVAWMGGAIAAGLTLAFETTGAIVTLAGKALLYLAGWVVLLVAFARSDWDTSVFGNAWADTVMKAVATLPAAGAAALLTTLIVVFLPRGSDGARRWLGIANVLACLVLTGLSFGGVLVLVVWGGPSPDGVTVPQLVYTLGYAPLLLVSALFTIAAVGVRFGASWVHRRAGGISTVLFTAGLVTTYVLLDRHGPVTLPSVDEPVTTAIVEAELGLVGAILLFAAGVLGVVSPATPAGDGS
jgi:hypothetical protein